MEPIKRNMAMKNVAGFHFSNLFPFAFTRFSFRKGLGTKDFQKPRSTTVAGLEAKYRHRTFLGSHAVILARNDAPVMVPARAMVRIANGREPVAIGIAFA